MTGGINFWSGKNYMKRDSTTGSTSIGAPKTLSYGGAVYITQYTVTHNLGYVPFFSLFYEPFGDGVIWEALATRSQSSATNPRNTAQTGPYCLGFASTTTLTIEIGYSSNTLSANYPIYWVIYKDYQL